MRQGSNEYIGRAVARAGARRLVEGHGRYVDDIELPRMGHLAFLRSPFAHARIGEIQTAQARARPAVLDVVTGKDIADTYDPWKGTLDHWPGLKSAPQHALAVDRVRWCGEPVVAIVAETRAEAEDAVELVTVDWEELPVLASPQAALLRGADLLHPELETNVAFEREVAVGDVEAALANGAALVEGKFRFGRHTGVSLEPRGIVAAFDPSTEQLTLYHSGQSPHQIQAIFAKILRLPEWQVRVVTPDVGGAFGLKLHIYGDEIVAAILSRRLSRPVKFIADRCESFLTDVHARDHEINARMAVDRTGKIVAFDIEDLTGIGPYAAYPRSSITEANMILNLSGTQYLIENFRAKARVVFQNKNLMAQLRAVGLPVAVTVCEHLVDQAAKAIGLDPVEIRRRNLVPDDAYPHQAVTGARFEQLSHHACLDRLLALMSYVALRSEQSDLRDRGVFRGIGLATFVEGTGPGSVTYGLGGAPISSQDGVSLRLEPTGSLVCAAGISEIGQGAEAMLGQVVAESVGVPLGRVRVLTGDTLATPYGGGSWGSRSTAICGEAAWQAGRALRGRILDIAAVLLQSSADGLDVRQGNVVDRATGQARLSLSELATTAYYRMHDLPESIQPEFMVTRHFRLTKNDYVYVNGVHASHVEVDTETGFIRVLGHWVVDDCGRMINPLLVSEQVRGGVIQGIGMALFEHCIYDELGQLCNGTLADYLVPMATEMPDIVCDHIETPSELTTLGAKGVGESGFVAAPAAVMNAVNDALSPFDARICETPITPLVVLRALGRLQSQNDSAEARQAGRT